MSDEPKKNPPGPPKELPMETRLLLAFALMGLILFATPYFFKTVAPPTLKKSQPAEQKQPAATAASAPPVEPAPPEAVKPEAGPAAQVSAKQEEIFTLDTDLYKVVLSNKGGVVHEWVLKKYTDDAGKPLQLFNTAAASKAGFPFALVMDQQKPRTDLNGVLFAAKPADDGLGITYEYSDGAVFARKTFRFQKRRYIAEVSSEVTLNGAAAPHLIAWRGGFGDPASAPGVQHSVYFDLAAAKLLTRDAKAAKNGPVASEGDYSFAGIEDTYFTAAFLPTVPAPLKVVTFSDTFLAAATGKEEPHVGTGVGSPAGNHFTVFVGPKDLDVLNGVNPQLVKIVDYGWFWFLAKPLFLALHYVNDKWVHNYGWAIIIVTVLINFLLFPLKLTSLKSTKKMQALQPQVAALQEKYKGLSMRDPRKQKQNEELMELYKKHGANPMGGCIPMVLQIPFFIAFYKVLAISIELRHAPWLWVSDLSSYERLPIHILPIAMIATQFIVQKMTPSPSVDPNQQRMMLMMPLVMGFIFYNLPSGLVLYYFTANLVGIAQQWFFNKTVTPADLPQPAPVAKKPAGRNRR
jgi:YidC/Oxa1 family membrane protein insertase